MLFETTASAKSIPQIRYLYQNWTQVPFISDWCCWVRFWPLEDGLCERNPGYTKRCSVWALSLSCFWGRSWSTSNSFWHYCCMFCSAMLCTYMSATHFESNRPMQGNDGIISQCYCLVFVSLDSRQRYLQHDPISPILWRVTKKPPIDWWPKGFLAFIEVPKDIIDWFSNSCVRLVGMVRCQPWLPTRRSESYHIPFLTVLGGV